MAKKLNKLELTIDFKPFETAMCSLLAEEFAYQYSKGWNACESRCVTGQPATTHRQLSKANRKWAKDNKNTFMQDAKRVLFGKAK